MARRNLPKGIVVRAKRGNRQRAKTEGHKSKRGDNGVIEWNVESLTRRKGTVAVVWDSNISRSPIPVPIDDLEIIGVQIGQNRMRFLGI